MKPRQPIFKQFQRRQTRRRLLRAVKQSGASSRRRGFLYSSQIPVLLTLIAFTCGMIGLPVPEYSGCGTDTGSCAAGGASGCRCSQADRSSGNCCCSRKSQTSKPGSCCSASKPKEPASCCSRQTEAPPACEESEVPELLWQACGCGCQSNTLFLSCDDPRLPLEVSGLSCWTSEESHHKPAFTGKSLFTQRPEVPPPQYS